MAEQDPTAKALHRIRSSLATLRADLELAMADAVPPSTQTIAVVDKALEWLASAEESAVDRLILGELESGATDGDVDPRGRVFVIDDDARHAELVARKLRKLGFDVDASKDVAAVAPTVGPHDTLIVDLGLLDGMDDWTAASVKAARSIVMTGAVGESARRRAEELGAMAFLVKPIKIDQLTDLLHGSPPVEAV